MKFTHTVWILAYSPLLFHLCESYKGMRRRYTQSLFYARLFDDFFLFNAPCKFIPLLNSLSLVFDFTLCGWLCSSTLTPYFWWEYHFLLTPLYLGLHPLSWNATRVQNKGWLSTEKKMCDSFFCITFAVTKSLCDRHFLKLEMNTEIHVGLFVRF
jgi:hypothetical protein